MDIFDAMTPSAALHFGRLGKSASMGVSRRALNPAARQPARIRICLQRQGADAIGPFVGVRSGPYQQDCFDGVEMVDFL